MLRAKSLGAMPPRHGRSRASSMVRLHCYCRLSGLLCAACLHGANSVPGGLAPAHCSAHCGACTLFAGDLASFIFRLMPTTAVFHPAGINNNIQYCGQGFSAIPNGVGFGGQVATFFPQGCVTPPVVTCSADAPAVSKLLPELQASLAVCRWATGPCLWTRPSTKG